MRKILQLLCLLALILDRRDFNVQINPVASGPEIFAKSFGIWIGVHVHSFEGSV